MGYVKDWPLARQEPLTCAGKSPILKDTSTRTTTKGTKIMSTEITHGRLTPELINMLCAMIEHGHYYSVACKALRISDSTFASWMRIGKTSATGVYRELYERVLHADAAAEHYALEKWRSHFDKDPRAAASFLARRWPERWGERKYIRIAVDKEIEAMLKELQHRLPEDIFTLVVNELASIDMDRMSIDMTEDMS